MEQTQREKLLVYVLKIGFIWIVFHFILRYLVLGSNMIEYYDKYSRTVYVLMIIYVASLLIFDTLVYMVRSFEANRVMKRYWAISCILSIIWILFRKQLMISESGGSIITLLLLWTATPLAPMMPVVHLLLFKGLGMEWSTVNAWHSVIVFILSAAHYFYFCWLSHRINREKPSIR